MEVGHGATTIGPGLVDTGVHLSAGTAMIIGTGTVTGTMDIVASTTKAFMAGFTVTMIAAKCMRELIPSRSSERLVPY